MTDLSKPRRAYGEGAITERTRGDKTYFVARVSGGYDAFGSRVRLERWCATRPAAKKALSQLEEQVRAGEESGGNRLTIETYLGDWLASLATSGSVKKSTRERYASTIAKHVLPILGRVRVVEFDTSAAITFYKRLEQDGRSASTRRKAHATLSARGAQLLGRNFLRREFYPTMARAKLRRITFHDLRHSGTMLISESVPITVLRERLGHTSTSTTLIYAGHRSAGNQRAAVDAFDAIFPLKTEPKRGEIGGTDDSGAA